jgi:Mlc titration factor MtfA (ptsG expression regulator)
VPFFRKWRRRRLREAPFPAAWRAIVDRNFALFHRLSTEDQAGLLGHINVFLREKSFAGCGGLQMTDEIRVTVAAQACLLLLHLEEPRYYPGLYTILVYPDAYLVPAREVAPDGVVTEGASARLGESWVRGAVVLSWNDVRAGAADAADGHNVILHEFAHQLDQEDGLADGAPYLERRSQYVAWARILGREFKKLQTSAALGRRTDIDRYGATSPAEFFAVTTEAFFERPRALHQKHPELYDELMSFYRQDPLTFAEQRKAPIRD